MFPLDGHFATFTNSFIIRKDHPLKRVFSLKLLKLLHDGVIDEILERYEDSLIDRKIEEEELKPLTIEDINGLFMIVSIKLGIAVAWSLGKKFVALLKKAKNVAVAQ